MSNEILKFCEDGTTSDLLTQAEYSADPERLIGNQPGIARQKLVNKVLRQCAYISNAFAEYIATKTGGNVLDNDDSAALQALIVTAFTYTFTNDNFIINGNFDFWQRNTTFAVSTTNTYTADRFACLMTGSTSTVARQATALTESFRANYFLRSAVTSSAGVSNFNLMTQKIENVVRLGGKQVTLSFWAKADSTRNMSIEFVQNFGTGGSPSADVNAQGVTKVALTTSWQQFTVTVTLASISGKVLGTDLNSSYTAVNFWLDAGANFNARTSSLGQQSGTFDIAQVKLELGSNATAFVLAGKTISGELAACQRYYEKTYNTDVVPGTATVNGRASSMKVTTGEWSHMIYEFAVAKRTTPTFLFWDLAGTATRMSFYAVGSNAQTNGGNFTNNAILGTRGFVWEIISGSVNVCLAYHYTLDAEL